MINILDKKNCTGCFACQNICPVEAITMDSDYEGFFYPKINFSKCIKCGKCERICPIIKKKNQNNSDKKIFAYASKTINENIRKKSSSGGIFTEVALFILNNNGVVFGASFDENHNVVHIKIDKKEDLYKLQGSKYVQSHIGNTYKIAKENLDFGKIVLFTGTPCQIAGLYSFLGKEYENLFTQDIVCHGVPSPYVWKKYIEYRESIIKSKVQSVNFRNKKTGWRNYSIIINFKNTKKYTKIFSNDLYGRSFLNNFCLRPSCYSCNFKNKIRESDFTLADFWGIEKIYSKIDDNKGVSLVLINSLKAYKLFQSIKENIEMINVNYDDALKFNQSIIKSAVLNNKRDDFINCVREKGFKNASKKYLKTPYYIKIKKSFKIIYSRINCLKKR